MRAGGWELTREQRTRRARRKAVTRQKRMLRAKGR